MIVGVLELELYIYESYSLKDKRQVMKSILDKIRNKHNVSIAEVDDLEIWNKAVIAISSVSNSKTVIEQTFQYIKNFIEADHRVEIINSALELN